MSHSSTKNSTPTCPVSRSWISCSTILVHYSGYSVQGCPERLYKSFPKKLSPAASLATTSPGKLDLMWSTVSLLLTSWQIFKCLGLLCAFITYTSNFIWAPYSSPHECPWIDNQVWHTEPGSQAWPLPNKQWLNPAWWSSNRDQRCHHHSQWILGILKALPGNTALLPSCACWQLVKSNTTNNHAHLSHHMSLSCLWRRVQFPEVTVEGLPMNGSKRGIPQHRWWAQL